MSGVERKIVLVTRHTRLEELIYRYQTLAQARFYVERLGADFREYVEEHETYTASRNGMIELLVNHGRYQVIDRKFLPNFMFAADDVVIALGQDGLVANAMKYLDGQPLIGVNPDARRNDGILLPFEPREVWGILPAVLTGKRPLKAVTMAKAVLSDGRTLFAVNDLFIGPRSQSSARYEIRLGEQAESQLSSGIIVSTGLGSTGWIRSVVTGSGAIAHAALGCAATKKYAPRAWDEPALEFAVREPFPSKVTATTLVTGRVTARQPLELISQMPENGVIFSDGIEADNLEFSSGIVAKIAPAERHGRLVV